jgi:hypothetical protein
MGAGGSLGSSLSTWDGSSRRSSGAGLDDDDNPGPAPACRTLFEGRRSDRAHPRRSRRWPTGRLRADADGGGVPGRPGRLPRRDFLFVRRGARMVTARPLRDRRQPIVARGEGILTALPPRALGAEDQRPRAQSSSSSPTSLIEQRDEPPVGVIRALRGQVPRGLEPASLPVLRSRAACVRAARGVVPQSMRARRCVSVSDAHASDGASGCCYSVLAASMSPITFSPGRTNRNA